MHIENDRTRKPAHTDIWLITGGLLLVFTCWVISNLLRWR